MPAIVKLACYPAYPGSDDAFIHIAVAEHILRGSGWGVISNDRVNMSSSPLYTVMLLPVLAVGSIGLAQLLSLICSCLGLLTTYLVTRSTTSSRLCAVAALGVAAGNVHLWRWSGTVMETTLAYLVVTVVAAAVLRLVASPDTRPLQYLGLGASIGLGTMVRFEIALLVPLALASLWISRRLRRVQVAAMIVGFAIVVLPWIVFASAYFGSPVPTTFTAKTGGFHLLNFEVTRQIGAVVVTGSGVSIMAAAIALLIASRSPQGRETLGGFGPSLLFLVGWPVSLFAFYYLKTASLMSAGRYFLPGMATWPVAVGLIVAAVASPRARRALTVGVIAGSLALALVMNTVIARPVLAVFNSGYRAAMAAGAAYLTSNCQPGDVAVIEVDIGIMAREGIGDCVLVDGGALATPSMRGLAIPEKVVASGATFFVESIGSSPGDFLGRFPAWRLEFSRGYPDHGIANYSRFDYLNVYRVRPSTAN